MTCIGEAVLVCTSRTRELLQFCVLVLMAGAKLHVGRIQGLHPLRLYVARAQTDEMHVQSLRPPGLLRCAAYKAHFVDYKLCVCHVISLSIDNVIARYFADSLEEYVSN